jgi:tyrosyl-tRNA synthetase
MFGKTMRITDALLPKYLRLLTDLPDAEIEALLAPGVNPRDAKLRLGEALVARYHGADAGRREREEFLHVFSEKRLPAEIPTVTLPAGAVSILDLVVACGFAASKGEARRLVGQGGVALDDVVVKDLGAQVAVKDGAILRVGSRRYARLAVAT